MLSAYVIIIALSVIPGMVWCSLKREPLRAYDFAVGTTFSPLLLATVFVVFQESESRAALPLIAALVFLLASCAGIMFRLKRSGASLRHDLRDVLGLGAMMILLCGACLFVWNANEPFSMAATHGFMHVEIIHAICEQSLPPEEPGMAGVALHYPWFGERAFAVLHQASGLAPTQVWVVTNLMACCATAVLLWIACRWMGVTRRGCCVALILAFLGVGVVGLVARLCMTDLQQASEMFGDRRFSGLIRKFFAFNLQPWAFAACAMTLACMLRLVRRPRVGTAIECGLALCVISVLYPHLHPPCVVLVLAGVLASRTLRRHRAWIWLVGGVIVSTFITFLVVRSVAAPSGPLGVTLTSWPAVFEKLPDTLFALSLFIVPVGAVLLRDVRRLGASTVMLVVASFASVAAYLVLRMTGTSEYKYIFTAGLFLSPLAARGFDACFKKRPGSATAFVVLLAASCGVIQVVERTSHWPATASQTAPYHAVNGVIAYRDAESQHLATTIREQSPSNAIVVLPEDLPNLHVLARRSAYVRYDDGSAPYSFGYNIPSRRNLVIYRGCDAAMYDRRVSVTRSLYGTNEESVQHVSDVDMLRALAALERPVIVVATVASSSFLLSAQREGIAVALDEDQRVWMLFGSDENSAGQ